MYLLRLVHTRRLIHQRSRDLEGVSEDEMLENLSSQGVSAVKRIHIRRNNELVPTNTFILTFSKPLLPDSIKAGYLKIPVVPFIPNPLRCFKCHRYGHGENACRGKVTCARYGQVDHESKTCHNAISCANCKGSHFAYSRECPKWKQEKQVQQVRDEKHVSFPESTGSLHIWTVTPEQACVKRNQDASEACLLEPKEN